MRKVLASLHRSTEVRSFAARSWSFPFYGSRGEGTVISPQVDVKTCKSATAKPRRDTKRVFFLRCSRNPGIKSSLWSVRRWLGHSSGANVGSSQAGSSCSTVHHLRILYLQLASFDLPDTSILSLICCCSADMYCLRSVSYTSLPSPGPSTSEAVCGAQQYTQKLSDMVP